jgi:thyrotropin-releasing hormone receptor
MESANLTQFLNDSAANLSVVASSPGGAPASTLAIVLVSLLFCVIEVVGVVGNLLVIYVVLGDPKMRRSATNLFIMNLALSDFAILAIGLPEIVQFMMNRGWVLGLIACKMHRYIMVVALYSSIMTLTAVCVER